MSEKKNTAVTVTRETITVDPHGIADLLDDVRTAEKALAIACGRIDDARKKLAAMWAPPAPTPKPTPTPPTGPGGTRTPPAVHSTEAGPIHAGQWYRIGAAYLNPQSGESVGDTFTGRWQGQVEPHGKLVIETLTARYKYFYPVEIVGLSPLDNDDLAAEQDAAHRPPRHAAAKAADAAAKPAKPAETPPAVHSTSAGPIHAGQWYRLGYAYPDHDSPAGVCTGTFTARWDGEVEPHGKLALTIRPPVDAGPEYASYLYPTEIVGLAPVDEDETADRDDAANRPPRHDADFGA